MSESLIGNREILILDTNVLIQDPFFFEKLHNKAIVIPFVVIAELDKIKYAPGEKGKNARTASSLIDKYRKLGDLVIGVKTQNDSILLYSSNMLEDKTTALIKLSSPSDEQIIKVALYFARTYKNVVKLISYDVNVKIQASGLGLDVADYDLSNNHELLHDLVYGELPQITYREIDPRLKDYIYSIKNKLHVFPFADMSKDLDIKEVYPNQCFVLRAGQYLIPMVYDLEKEGFIHIPYINYEKGASKESKEMFRPKNIEQLFAYHFLKDPNCLVVSIGGGPGTGKNFVSLMAGFEQLNRTTDGRMIDVSDEEGALLYEQLLVYRPNVEIGEPMGYLPGDIVDKFSPFTRPIEDNLKALSKLQNSFLRDFKDEKNILAALMAGGYLSIEPVNFIQGRTIWGRYILVDEFQNLKPEDTEIVVTRPGERSKLIINGDLFQVYNEKLDIRHNGFSHYVKIMAGMPGFAHVTLKTPERSLISKMYMDAKQKQNSLSQT